MMYCEVLKLIGKKKPHQLKQATAPLSPTMFVKITKTETNMQMQKTLMLPT